MFLSTLSLEESAVLLSSSTAPLNRRCCIKWAAATDYDKVSVARRHLHAHERKQ
jgi:hypothetical protein